MSDSLRCCGLQHARLPCPSLSPRVCSDSRPLSQWQHPTTLSSAVPFPSRLRSSPAPGLPSEPALPIRRPKDWSCTISPSNEYSGLISFRIDWFDLLAAQGTLKSLLQYHNLKASILWVKTLFMEKVLVLVLSRFSRVQLCATPSTAAQQAPPSLGFSRQEHWSGLPFPSPMHESEKSK